MEQRFHNIPSSLVRTEFLIPKTSSVALRERKKIYLMKDVQHTMKCNHVMQCNTVQENSMLYGFKMKQNNSNCNAMGSITV